ncbi:XAP5, circadian clock regulator-domain-containing protein [Diaporthe sp. PMI_573]|nr:XAP5, circadian clock regulator-domain-containing protein [Diaporthaceae sp. PMI_573]
MSNSSTPAQVQSRFKAPNNMSTQERISTNTVGLVNLSDFRKRRAEVLEQQEREAREALRSGTTTPLIDRSQSATPNNLSDGGSERPVKKQRKPKKALVSFGDDEQDDDAGPALESKGKANKAANPISKAGDQSEPSTDGDPDPGNKDSKKPGGKVAANTSIGFVPRAMTKSALRREAAERDALRKEFLALQEAVKAAEIAMPFVFYDGTNIPGGTVRVKKGEFVWVFLDKSRKVGAELGVGGEKNANVRREWARVGVDDLMLVRGTMIIPHHYEFYFFIMNKTVGPGNVRLFDYSAEAPSKTPRASGSPEPQPNPLSTSASKGGLNNNLVDINTLEGANEDPAFTKVVDRRWYERNKHIYPASVWQEFDPEKDYTSEVRKDTGGNTFFFSK